jgi:4-amino-4-deoxy-L-arabinose transferase-like glycosyltransferase
MLGAIALGALLALAWAIPAGMAGGEEYRRLIFWGQSAGRIANSFAHKRPFWWYFALLPLLWFPWAFWPPLWRAARAFRWDSGLRFCAAQGLSILLLFSLISGKQIHYLLPMFPALALIAARSLSQAPSARGRFDQAFHGALVAGFAAVLLALPWFGAVKMPAILLGIAPAVKLGLLALGGGLLFWRPENTRAGVRILALAMLGCMLCAHLVFQPTARKELDLRPFAAQLRQAEDTGAAFAYWKKYSGDFNFLARLKYPVQEIHFQPELLAWMQIHPQDCVIIVYEADAAGLDSSALFSQAYRGSTRRIGLWRSASLLAHPEALAQLLK